MSQKIQNHILIHNLLTNLLFQMIDLRHFSHLETSWEEDDNPSQGIINHHSIHQQLTYQIKKHQTYSFEGY